MPDGVSAVVGEGDTDCSSVGIGVSVGVIVGAVVGVSPGTTVSVAVAEGLGVAVSVGGKGVALAVAVMVIVAVFVGELVKDGVTEGVVLAVGEGVNVAVMSGTNVGVMNSVGVAVWVGSGTGVGELNCQRRIRLTKPRQYIHDVVSIISASSRDSNLWRLSKCSYCSRNLLTRVSPEQYLPERNDDSGGYGNIYQVNAVYITGALNLALHHDGNHITFWQACQTI